jgi:hypothetical protein
MPTGTAIKGMIADRQFCGREDDERVPGSPNRAEFEHFLDRFADERRRIVADQVVRFGELLGRLHDLGADDVGRLKALASGNEG